MLLYGCLISASQTIGLESIYIRDKINNRIECRLEDTPENLHAWRTGYRVSEEQNNLALTY